MSNCVGFPLCYKCSCVMNPKEVLYSEVHEIHVQIYQCPNCGHEEEDDLE